MKDSGEEFSSLLKAILKRVTPAQLDSQRKRVEKERLRYLAHHSGVRSCKRWDDAQEKLDEMLKMEEFQLENSDRIKRVTGKK